MLITLLTFAMFSESFPQIKLNVLFNMVPISMFESLDIFLVKVTANFPIVVSERVLS